MLILNDRIPAETKIEALAEQEIEVIEQITMQEVPKEKTNFDMFVLLRQQGYTLKQIHQEQLLPLAYNSLKNYNCKYNKLKTV